jgi:asparagine synthase (glutamine-hydrolysing)
MCGIAGIARFKSADDSSLRDVMVKVLEHRGPDEHGVYGSVDEGLSLGMTRLSIIDLAGGHQPMYDERRRYVLVFNGEIYNYHALWTDLAGRGHAFATDHSDTEVIVHGFEEWGDRLFSRLNGMFAIAIWDRDARRLTLARDRMGEKPLYLAKLNGGGWAFASELKALLALPELPRDLDLGAVEQYLSYDYTVGPRTVLRDVRKLPAGHVAHVDQTGATMEAFWTPSFELVQRAPQEVVSELDRLLAQSVQHRMIADVPVGLFLSGGLDSTTIGYYMTQQSSHVEGFSIGFEDPSFDESSEARAAAKHLGITHHVETFADSDVRALVPRVTEILDEPMGDPSVFPTYLLSLITRKQVKVALGGDGSDELLMGYRAYQLLKVAALIAGTPGAARLARLVGSALPIGGPRRVRRVARLARRMQLGPEERLLGLLGSFDGESRWIFAKHLRQSLGPGPFADAAHQFAQSISSGHDAQRRTAAAYLRGYLQEDILVKVDRASMAASLEVRSPFLDPAIVDFALSLPPSQKMPGLRRKAPLRDLMRGRLPDRLIDRPKRGFGVPLAAWFRGPLLHLVNEHLSAERMIAGGLFDERRVRSLIDAHLGGDDRSNELWVLLQFQMWQARWLERPAASIAA